VVGDPAYPIHIYAVALAGANVIRVPLGNDADYLKRIAYLAEHLYPRPKLAIFNYPHNPSALTIEPAFWDEVVCLAKHFGFMVISDFAYGETCFDGYQAPSFLAAKDAKKVGVEFTTASKPYNMAGWRVGFCAGNPRMVEALGTIKGYYDYGLFQAIQVASIIALRHGDDFIRKQAEIYRKRRDVLTAGLNRIGWKTEKPRASMFVWTRVADEHLAGKGTIDFALRMMEEAEVAAAPGRAFGECGEGYLRIALVENELRLKQALRQIECMVKNRPLRKAPRKADKPPPVPPVEPEGTSAPQIAG
jgi:alanine-synthesizing transaminase